MTIQEKIDDLVQRTRAFTENNPEINFINWNIENIPYSEFNLFRETHNESYTKTESRYLEEIVIGDRMYIILMYFVLDAKCNIALYSTPVKITTYHQVEEVNQ